MPARAATAIDVLVIAALRLNTREIRGVSQEALLWWARDAGLKISERTFRTTLRKAERNGIVTTFPVTTFTDEGEPRKDIYGYTVSSEVELSGVRFTKVAEETYTIAVSPDYPEPSGRMPLPAGWARTDLTQPAAEAHKRVIASLAHADLPF